ncbi:hypothetical protein ROA7450_03583 [Roseovarius albus]|uniref:Alpha/beta hydrolase family protein n=1 Tax=Roseovarius albus TaxID=1247867 RepID=A0A1X7A143_9RHOB|nr:alpha/beta hydrolase [Roseovarius albus]SLN67238.1 hypothetical protein ROA7450_03583 [Roseovarius albus]
MKNCISSSLRTWENLRKQNLFKSVFLCFVTFGLLSCSGPKDLVDVPTTVPVESVPEVTKHRIFIATSRAKSDESGEFYSGERGRGLNFASVTVSIPPEHRKGKIERPGSLPADPEKHFVINDPKNFKNRSAFQTDLSAHLSTLKQDDRNLLVFIHGYNTNLTSAILQVSQFVEDSGYDGVPVLFSWASSGKTVKYVYDINSALVARDHLVSMFSTLQIPIIKGYDVVAHSMGTLLVMEASRQIAMTTGLNPTGKVRNVVLAAPDIDIDLFISQIRLLPAKGRNIIIMVSKDDAALKASRRIAGGVQRVGQTSATELSKLGVTAIDLSEVQDKSSFSHSKFKDSPAVVQLIGTALEEKSSFNQGPSLSLGQVISVGVDGAIKAIPGTGG